MKTRKFDKLILLLIAVVLYSCSDSKPVLKYENDNYNFSLVIHCKGDSAQKDETNPFVLKKLAEFKDSILLQFGDGFYEDSLRLISNNDEYKQMVLTESNRLGYSGDIVLSNKTTEFKFNINNGPIISIPINKRRIFFIYKSGNNIEILELRRPARFM